MKKYIISIVSTALCLMSAYADNISVADVSMSPGKTQSVSINLTNTETNLVSFQMDLTLPDGITVNKSGCSLSGRFPDDQELTIGRQSNGDIRLTSTSFNLTPISGTSGEIITLSLTASADSEGGTATISNIRFVTSNSERITLNNTTFNISVGSTSPNITFADPAVKAICVGTTTNWDTNHDGELSEAEAAAVTDLGEVFKENTSITSFNELQYFTGLTSISNNAFYGCSSLTSVTIPNSVTSIDFQAFYGCSSLTSITIPNSVTSIGYQAFFGCSGLTSIAIPNSVTSIGYYVFEGCSGLTSIIVESGNTVYDSRNSCNAIIETASNTLVVGCQNTIIPSSVTSIGNGAFAGCTSLTSITIPNSVTSIGYRAFDGTEWYNNQPDGLVYAGKVAYKYKGTMPAGTSIMLKDGTTGIAGNAFYKCTGLTSITIPNSVTNIGGTAFSYCSGLTSVTIPNSVTDIGTQAFHNCTSLTTVTLSENLTSLSDGTFWGCSSLTSIIIPNSVTSIGKNPAYGGAFEDCSGLTSVTIGNSITTIGGCTFWDCSNLTDVWCYAEEVPETVYDDELDNDSFDYSLIASATLHVPAASLEAYSNTAPWSGFGTIVPIEEAGIEVTDISQLENAIYIDRVEARAGATATLSVKMKNSFIAEGFGFDLVLPEGITVALDEYGFPMAELSTERTNSRITNHFDVDFKPDGSLNVQAYSTRGLPIEGHDGEVALITIHLSDDLTAGEYPIILKNIAITDENSSTVTIEQVTSVLEVPAYIIGDANNDGNVNVGDLTAISHYILERPDASFLFPAADANQDGNVNVGDLTAVSHIILWGSIVRPQQGAPVKAVLPKSSLLLDPQ